MSMLKRALPMTDRRSNAGFGTDVRKVFVSNSFTPGPGSYVAPSAFGQYVGERALMAESQLTRERGQHTGSKQRIKSPSVEKSHLRSLDDIGKLVSRTYDSTKKRRKSKGNAQSPGKRQHLRASPVFY